MSRVRLLAAADEAAPALLLLAASLVGFAGFARWQPDTVLRAVVVAVPVAFVAILAGARLPRVVTWLALVGFVGMSVWTNVYGADWMSQGRVWETGQDLLGARPLWLVGCMVAAVGVAATASRWLPWPVTASLVVLFLGYGTWVASLYPDALSDVTIFNREAGEAILHGRNPYEVVFTSPYSPEYSAVVYGPGMVVDGVLQVGYPYLPVAALLFAPAVLLGDLRLALTAAIAVAVAALLFAQHRTEARPRVVSPWLLAILPGVVYVIGVAWTEPLSVGLLGLSVALLLRRSPWAAVALGLLFVSKQYFVVALPLVVLLLPLFREIPGGIRRNVGVALGTGAAVSVPFLLWNPSQFWESVVTFQFHQPFRADSVSALAWLVNHHGWPPESVFGVLPFAGALLAAGVLAWRAPRTPAAFAACVGAVLLVMVLLSKQAFLNYYFLVIGAFAIAAVTWTARRT